MGIKKDLAGTEDIALGTGTRTQIRNGQQVTITEVNASNIPFDASQSIKAVIDPIKAGLDTHLINTGNPHNVTVDQIGAAYRDHTHSELHTHSNKAVIDQITSSGDGSRYLADDGNYKLLVAQAYWGSIQGTLSNQTDLQSALDSKSPSNHTHEISDVTGLETELNNKANVGDSFLKSEHITESTGSADAGKPIVTDSNGMIHPTVAGSGLYPVGPFTPVDTAEYPDTTGENPGAWWTISGVADIGYTYTGGDLAGTTVYNGDLLIHGTTSWIHRLASTLDPNEFYRLDGSLALTGPMAGGGQQAKNFAPATEVGDLVEYSQITSFATDFMMRDGSLPMTGAFDGGGFAVTNIADGAADTDGATVGQLASKADITYVDNGLASKADITYVDQQDNALQADIDTHTADTSNPHQVTAGQVGADPAGSAQAVQDNLDTHTADTSNPHSVTAAQVGALPLTGGTLTGALRIDVTPAIALGGDSDPGTLYPVLTGWTNQQRFKVEAYMDGSLSESILDLDLSGPQLYTNGTDLKIDGNVVWHDGNHGVVGEIKQFVGDPKDLPQGWYVADGTNGTIDMSSDFKTYGGTQVVYIQYTAGK